MVLDFTLVSVICFELIFIEGVRHFMEGVNPFALLVDVSLLRESLLFSHLIALALLLKII